MSDMRSADLVKKLIASPDEWFEFYVQPDDRRERSDYKHARNKANTLRMYARRNGYPIEVVAKKEKDGLIHCWGRWYEGGESSQQTGQ